MADMNYPSNITGVSVAVFYGDLKLELTKHDDKKTKFSLVIPEQEWTKGTVTYNTDLETLKDAMDTLERNLSMARLNK